MNRRATLVLLSLSLGCSAASPRPAVAPRAVPAPAPTPQAAVLDGPSQPDSAVDGRLSLKAALRSAQAHSPELAAAALELQAQAELQNVAGRLPDPEFSVGVEGLPFSTPRSGEEFLAGISQPIPLNGRLAGQEDLANARLQALQVRRDRIAGQVEVQLRGAFATALSLQEAAEVQASRVASAQFAEELAAARVQAGDLTPDALGSILADRVQLARELRDLRARSAAARSELFAMMGSRESAADLEASLDQVLELPAFEALADRIEAIPAVTEAMAQARVAELAADLAAAQTVPLVNLDLFYRQRGDERDSFDLGLHFEVPLSGTTAAESRAARARASAASQYGRLQLRESLVELRRRHTAVARALDLVNGYEQQLLPASAAALAIAEARLAAGDLSPVDVLPLRDHDARVRLARLDAWHRLLSAWAQLTPFLPGE